MAELREISLEVTDRVGTITLNRPERMNAWTPMMEAQFRDSITLASTDDNIRAIVVTGAGRAFCVGAEMGQLSANSKNGRAAQARTSQAGDFEQRYSYLLAVPKPIIAAINGAVAGVGLCIALYCDLRYMAAGSKLSTAFVRRGLVAEHGSAWMLPRLIGPMNAADLLLSARTVTAEEADRMGLVRALPTDGFRDAVQHIASDLANLSSPRAMGVIKRQLSHAPFQGLAEATRLSEEEIAKCRGTEDYREGIAHYLAKRKPEFTGN